MWKFSVKNLLSKWVCKKQTYEHFKHNGPVNVKIEYILMFKNKKRSLKMKQQSYL